MGRIKPAKDDDLVCPAGRAKKTPASIGVRAF
jgi:hypothetical protein